MSENLQGAFQELMKTGHVDTSGIPVAVAAAPRARGAGVRGGMPAAAAVPVPVRETSFQKALKAEARMRYGQQKKNEQNLDPTGEKLASVLAEATPVNVTYGGRTAASIATPNYPEKVMESEILSNRPNLSVSPLVEEKFDEFKREKAAIGQISNSSLKFKRKKNLDRQFENYFRVNKSEGKIGRALFDAYTKATKEANPQALHDYADYLQYTKRMPPSFIEDLLKYIDMFYDELKAHYAYYNAKAAKGGKGRSHRRRSTKRKQTRRR